MENRKYIAKNSKENTFYEYNAVCNKSKVVKIYVMKT